MSILLFVPMVAQAAKCGSRGLVSRKLFFAAIRCISFIF